VPTEVARDIQPVAVALAGQRLVASACGSPLHSTGQAYQMARELVSKATAEEFRGVARQGNVAKHGRMRGGQRSRPKVLTALAEELGLYSSSSIEPEQIVSSEVAEPEEEQAHQEAGCCREADEWYSVITADAATQAGESDGSTSCSDAEVAMRLQGEAAPSLARLASIEAILRGLELSVATLLGRFEEHRAVAADYWEFGGAVATLQGTPTTRSDGLMRPSCLTTSPSKKPVSPVCCEGCSCEAQLAVPFCEAPKVMDFAASQAAIRIQARFRGWQIRRWWPTIKKLMMKEGEA
jgi:hypothetical protein